MSVFSKLFRGSGTHKLTKDAELSALDAAYKKTVDNFVTMEKTNQHAREIIGKEKQFMKLLVE